jgi:ankyrin repeat protein
MKSAAKGHEATVRLLLDLGMDKRAKDKSGQTALHHAVKNGYEAITRLLIQQGVPKRTRDNQGRTAMHLAILKL